MPANLPPEYFGIEKRYRSARSPAEKLEALEELLAVIPKHKGTDKLRADFKRRLSKLKSQQQTKKPTSRRDVGYRVDREGAGQVVLVGPPNVGKSALVAALTNATPAVADFPHTTRMPTPGMMPYKDIQIQLIDTPPMTQEFMEPWLPDIIRRADIILLIVDVTTDPMQHVEETIALLEERRIAPIRLAHLHEENQGWTFRPVLVVGNKSDDASAEENFQIFKTLIEDDWPAVPVSATTGRNFELLKQTLFDRLEIIRVYTKARGKAPEHNTPFVLKKGSTVEDLAGKIHKEFVDMIQRDYVLQDGDVVELHL
ncbi:MAG: 50S ribosome-binding GTPase [Deltaproteobacteria bacterium]|nr:50S ribosome-binding GTPase [Deltaproteobacteria bacterium]